MVSCKQGHGFLTQLQGRETLEEAAVQRPEPVLAVWIRRVYIIAAGVTKRYINLLIGIKLMVMLIQMHGN